MKSFLAVREFLGFCTKRKLPVILYKVDFHKAFNTVDWCFLINLLIEQGFPPIWTSTIINIMRSTYLTIKVNGSQTRYFINNRGLQYKDHLSPMLFILVGDSLNRNLDNARHLMHPYAFMPPEVIQFANDTLIISEAHPTTLKVIARTLQVYYELSGLNLNPNKSTFVPIAILSGLIQSIQLIILASPS